MLSGTGTLSLRKLDLENQKIPATGFRKTVFAHKAAAGETGINLGALTTPTEMSANGFSQPTTTEISNAQLLFYRNNLRIVSSARGLLQDYVSYTVAGSTSIRWLNFTALEGEIFVGTIDYNAQTGIKVVDASSINATGTLPAGTADFNVGPFKLNKYPTTQIGDVMVFLDGILQLRNTGNSSTTLDGNYYEVDAGNGLGSIIRFNIVDPDNIRNIVVTSNGLLSERPDGSMMAQIESIQGQINNMGTYVSTLAGLSLSTVLGGAPSNVDLKAFGDRVLTLEQNRARIDLSNTWTAYQAIPGRTDGTVSPTGDVGEIIRAFTASSVNVPDNTPTTVHSTVFQPGDYIIWGHTTASATGADATTDVVFLLSLDTSPNNSPDNDSTDGCSTRGLSLAATRRNTGRMHFTFTTATTIYLNLFRRLSTGTSPSAVSAANSVILAQRIS